MRRIDTATKAVDLFGAGKHGFKNGDPATAVLATRLNAEHFNAIQEEIASVVEGTGTALDPADNGQLFTAIKSLFRSATLKATETLLGVLRVGTQSEVNAGVLSDVAVTPAKLRFGFQASFTSNGYIIFPTWLGSFVLQWMTFSHTTGGTQNWPIAFPNACFVAFPVDDSATAAGLHTIGVQSKSVTGALFTSANLSGATDPAGQMQAIGIGW